MVDTGLVTVYALYRGLLKYTGLNPLQKSKVFWVCFFLRGVCCGQKKN